MFVAKILCGKYLPLKIGFAILTFYLLYLDFSSFFFKKPTFTSFQSEKIKPQQKPDVIICPRPGYNTTALKTHGYASSFWYTMGQIQDVQPRGWTGNKETDVVQVLEEIMILKMSTELILLRQRLN